MPALVYCKMRGVDVNFSFCYGCYVPKERNADPDECPHAGIAQEDMI